MSSHHDVIVVGIGSMGAAACLHLARRGAKVFGIDSQPVPSPPKNTPFPTPH